MDWMEEKLQQLRQELSEVEKEIDVAEPAHEELTHRQAKIKSQLYQRSINKRTPIAALEKLRKELTQATKTREWMKKSVSDLSHRRQFIHRSIREIEAQRDHIQGVAQQTEGEAANG